MAFSYGIARYICKAISFLDFVSFAVSTAVDRFVAVVFPIKAHPVLSRFRGIVIVAIWETICTYVDTSFLSFRLYKSVCQQFLQFYIVL